MKVFKVENSPHRAEYEKMRAEGKTLKEIADRAAELGENISMMAFSRYFKLSWKPYLDNKLASDVILREKAMEVQNKWRNVMQICLDNLSILKAEAESLGRTNLDIKEKSALVNILREIRLTAKDIFEYMQKIQEISGTAEVDREIEAMKRAIAKVLPPEKAGELLVAYEEELNKSNNGY